MTVPPPISQKTPKATDGSFGTKPGSDRRLATVHGLGDSHGSSSSDPKSTAYASAHAASSTHGELDETFHSVVDLDMDRDVKSEYDEIPLDSPMIMADVDAPRSEATLDMNQRAVADPNSQQALSDDVANSTEGHVERQNGVERHEHHHIVDKIEKEETERWEKLPDSAAPTRITPRGSTGDSKFTWPKTLGRDILLLPYFVHHFQLICF